MDTSCCSASSMITYWWNSQKFFPACSAAGGNPVVLSSQDLEIVFKHYCSRDYHAAPSYEYTSQSSSNEEEVFGAFWLGKLEQFLKMTTFPSNLKLLAAAPPKKPRKMDNPKLWKGLDALTSSLNHVGDTIGNALEVVSSRQWPSMSRYIASVRTPSPKVEMIDNFFNKVSDTEGDGIMRELLLDF